MLTGKPEEWANNVLITGPDVQNTLVKITLFIYQFIHERGWG